MVKEKVLVVGLGEVGRPLFELLKESGKFEVYGYDLDARKMRDVGQPHETVPETVHVMHVCIPYADKETFTKVVVEYANRFKPKLIIVNSTVAPGTTMEIYKRLGEPFLVAHSPVRGVHKSLEHMKWELKRWIKYIGGVNEESAQQAQKHFEKLGLKTKVLKSSFETELAKLFETTYRAWMIVCFQEMHRISRHFGADFDEVVDFIEDTHRVRLDRPVMFPGVIGGHCLIPNTRVLLNSFDSKLLQFILESNEKREVEVKDKSVEEEIERVKRRVEKMEKELTKLVMLGGG
ncbi:MAG: GDP-mannose dehydrogenase [Candidatus Bathyarchaeota archaeon]|nr:GDP-mannose dehydrogenase [Candidatus Bathyarchaeota archaeon]MDW8022447.1 GDP-mannose dehydrogenase [Nitrososphaerota archaeon]MDW8040708.1 GDP-mannose dehydrogenase [Nitrososphaerota archaeon]